MLAWSIGWQELVVLFVPFLGLTFVAALVLLIVGLCTHTRGLTIAGAVMTGLAVGLVLLVVLALLAFSVA